MQFNAAVLFETNTPLRIIERVEVPVLHRGQVLVKMHYAGICHSQLMEQQGKRGVDKYLPHMLGHEGTGEVIDVGPQVTKVKTGQKVVLGWLKGSGLDAGGTVYQSPQGAINAGPVATFNEYAVVSENRCYLLPENLDVRESVLLGCAIPTGFGIVNNQIKSASNSHLAVMGLGGIGMSALMAAAQIPHGNLIAIDQNPAKLQLAEKLGATHCLNSNNADIFDTIADITDGHMLDYIVEAAGSCETIELAFSYLHPTSGTCVFASHPESGKKITLDPHELICGKKIFGSWGGASDPEEVVEQIAKGADKHAFGHLLSDHYPLSEINVAMENFKAGKELRAIIKF